jgi:hypothetical protein
MASIPLQLTPEQAHKVRRGALEIQLSEQQALSIRGAITAAGGAGAPEKLRPCPYCRRQFGARALRAHIPSCRRMVNNEIRTV